MISTVRIGEVIWKRGNFPNVIPKMQPKISFTTLAFLDVFQALMMIIIVRQFKGRQSVVSPNDYHHHPSQHLPNVIQKMPPKKYFTTLAFLDVFLVFMITMMMIIIIIDHVTSFALPTFLIHWKQNSGPSRWHLWRSLRFKMNTIDLSKKHSKSK